jgi:pyridoxine kinase
MWGVRVLSIQSSVAYGHAGNSVAVFPLQRLGHEVVAVHTVHFASHTGYGAARGPLHTPAELADMLAQLAELGVLGSTDAVLSGYLGDPSTGAVVLRAVADLKAANPAAVFCCDPVMGDVGRGFYVGSGVPEFFRDRALPVADVLAPNHFELAWLTGRELPTFEEPWPLDDVLSAVDEVRARGPRTLLVTSVRRAGLEAAQLETIAVSDEGAWAVTSPILPITTAGTGDLTSALFLAHLADGVDVALARTVSSVHAVLAATVESGERELRIVAAQDAIAEPPMDLPVRRLR